MAEDRSDRADGAASRPSRRRNRRRIALPPHIQTAIEWASIALGLYVLLEAAIRLTDLVMAGGFSGQEPGIVTFAQFLLHVPLVMLFVIWWLKRLPVWGFMLCLSIAWFANEAALLDVKLHDLLLAADLYPGFVPRTQQGFVNPQYAKLLVYTLALIGVIPLMVRKRWRSLDRVWVVMVAGAVLVTTAVFHLVIVHGAYTYAGEERKTLIETALKLDDPRGFEDFCRTYRFECQTQPVTSDIRFGLPHERAIFDQMRAEAEADPDNPRIHSWQNARPGDLDLVLVANYGAAARDGQIRMVIDSASFTAVNHRFVGWFSALSITAHLIWIFGGMGTLYLHHRLWARKRARSALMAAARNTNEAMR
ncbi:MAG: hypothetical protein Alpg2KO_22250 [Alphaproteobacteria bacterium]